MTSRRDFLGEVWRFTGLALSAAGLFLLARALRAARRSPEEIRVPKGLLASIGAGQVVGGKLFVTVSNEGPKALSLECTHLGCRVRPMAEGFLCPCHGSRYAADGRVLGGPAARPLARVPLEPTGDGWIARL